MAITQLGTAFRTRNGPTFGIQQTDRLQHLLILGQTGTGKSTLLKSMALQDANQGHGFCIIDPHGDLAEELHQTIETDHLYWNVADPHSPYGYNPIPHAHQSLRPLIASGFVDTLRHQWANAWGPRMENLLRYGVLALLDQPQATIADLMPLYTDKAFRLEVLQHIQDAECRRFWAQEYPQLSYNTAFDGVAPISNKLGALLSHPTLRRSLTAAPEPLRFRQIIDEGQILIVNLGKGRMGAEPANVMGGLILTGLRNAAFSRYDTPVSDRTPYVVSVDEFHNFTTDSVAESLSELRKYGLSLTLAGQYLSQSSNIVQDAILGNVGTAIAFRLGISDAPKLSRYLQYPSERDLLNLPNHHAYCRLMIDGTQSKAFSMKTVVP
jgi:energy-coupling factor transporter ATP-binding protein EcfA2